MFNEQSQQSQLAVTEALSHKPKNRIHCCFLKQFCHPWLTFFLQQNNIPEILVELTVLSIWLQINLQCEAIFCIVCLNIATKFSYIFFPHPVRCSVLLRAKELEINRAVIKERELGISLATMNAAPGYFHRKIEEK